MRIFVPAACVVSACVAVAAPASAQRASFGVKGSPAHVYESRAFQLLVGYRF